MIEIIAKIVISLIASIYYIRRFKKYIEKNKNNNVTGDVLFRWESVSIIDKYHIRERFFRGSKLRIKRDAKRYEIKYYWITYLFAIAFIYSSTSIDDIVVYVIAVCFLIFTIKLLFDLIERKGGTVKILADLLLYLVSLTGYTLLSAGFFLQIKDENDIKKISVIDKFVSIQPTIYIPLAITLAIFIFSIVKKRYVSVFVCVSIVIATFVSIGFTADNGANNCIAIYYIGYLYLTLIIMQIIYNVRALRKITFIN